MHTAGAARRPPAVAGGGGHTHSVRTDLSSQFTPAFNCLRIWGRFNGKFSYCYENNIYIFFKLRKPRETDDQINY